MSAQEQIELARELRLPARVSELVAARSYARALAGAFGMDQDQSYDFVYAANEAVTNAIRHGSPAGEGEIVLSANLTAERLSFSVRDYGAFAMPRTLDAQVEAGRGFALMVELVDDVKLRIHADGTTVTLVKLRM